MTRRIDYRTMVSVSPGGAPFNPAVAFGSAGGGLLDISRWSDRYKGLLVPVLSFTFNSAPTGSWAVNLAFADRPGDATRRKLLLEDIALYSFVEDNLGQGWYVPYRQRQPDIPWVVEFAASQQSGPVADAALIVELWWEERFPGAWQHTDDCRSKP